MVQGAIVALEVAEVVFLAGHDFVPLGRLTNRAAVRGVESFGRLVRNTVLSTAPYAAGLVASVYFWPHWPGGLVMYLRVSYAVLLGGALLSWWIPYCFGAKPEQVERFRKRFAGTLGFVPERHGIRPDGLHVGFHLSLLGMLGLLYGL